jgi:hypothetical protein
VRLLAVLLTCFIVTLVVHLAICDQREASGLCDRHDLTASSSCMVQNGVRWLEQLLPTWHLQVP